MSLLARGQRVGDRFVLEHPLGRGGMSHVWLANDSLEDRKVVLKIASSSPSEIESALLEREFGLLRRLEHPNIVRAFDFGRDAGHTYLALEYIDGGDVQQQPARPAEQLAEMLIALARALEHAHARGVTHRDLKASNILLDSQGRPYLCDFGIADSSDTKGSVVGGGSTASASPQQLSGRPPSPADDIYSFGILIEQLAGRDPASSSLLNQRLHDLARAMTSTEPDRRPASMSAVRSTLEGISEAFSSEATEAPALVRPPEKLVPPPRVRPEFPGPGVKALPEEPASRSKAITIFVVTLLMAAVVTVFVLLPRWVDRRASSKPHLEQPVNPSGPDLEAAPVAQPSTRSEPQDLPPELEPLQPALEVSAAGSESPIRPSPAREPAAPMPATSGFEPLSTGQSRQNPDYSRLMSAGLSALDRKDWKAAAESFRRAQEIVADSPQASRGLAQALAGLQVETIAAHRIEAESREAGEDWRAAARAYQAVLALDPAIRFAQIGLEQAAARAILDERLEFHLSRLDRLSSEKVLASASDVVAEAKEAANPGARLSAQISRLEEALRVASTPVPVRFESDNQTNVVVYKVGVLGRFDSRTLDLRPGSYTVVGSRAGYRDVRLQLVVGPGASAKPFAIRCTEAI